VSEKQKENLFFFPLFQAKAPLPPAWSTKKKRKAKLQMEINLPSFDISLRQHQGRREVFDFLRQRFVTLTPEEWVRQHFVHFLVEHKGYPKGLLANEMELRVGEKRLRCDTVLYNTALQPQMIIEYKAPSVTITQRVFDQIVVYNMLLHVDYLVVSNGLHHYCCRMDYARHSYEFLPDIPDYSAAFGLNDK